MVGEKWETFERIAPVYCIMYLFGEKSQITPRKLVIKPPNPQGDADAEFQLDLDETYFMQMKSKALPSKVTVKNPKVKEAVVQLFKKFCSFYPQRDTTNRRFIAIIEGYLDSETKELDINAPTRPYWILNEVEQLYREEFLEVIPDLPTTEQQKCIHLFFQSFYLECLPELQQLIKGVKERLKGKYPEIMVRLYEPPHTIQSNADFQVIIKGIPLSTDIALNSKVLESSSAEAKANDKSYIDLHEEDRESQIEPPVPVIVIDNPPPTPPGEKSNHIALKTFTILVILSFFLIFIPINIAGINLHSLGWVSLGSTVIVILIYLSLKFSEQPRITARKIAILLPPLFPLVLIIAGTLAPDNNVLLAGQIFAGICWAAYSLYYIGPPVVHALKQYKAEGPIRKKKREKARKKKKFKEKYPKLDRMRQKVSELINKNRRSL